MERSGGGGLIDSYCLSTKTIKLKHNPSGTTISECLDSRPNAPSALAVTCGLRFGEVVDPDRHNRSGDRDVALIVALSMA